MSFSKILTLQGERVFLTTPFRTYEARYARHRAKKGPRRIRTYRYVVTGWGDTLRDGEVIGTGNGLTMNQSTYDRLKKAIDNQRRD